MTPPDMVGTVVFSIDEAKAIGAALSRLFLTPPPCRPEERCMGKGCPRRAEYGIVALDRGLGAHDNPVQLCRYCLIALDMLGRPVDLFRWLSNNRIEATG